MEEYLPVIIVGAVGIIIALGAANLVRWLDKKINSRDKNDGDEDNIK